jgi:hypothetical protein
MDYKLFFHRKDYESTNTVLPVFTIEELDSAENSND